MSTLGAMLLVIVVLGMLLAYYIGFAVGQREGFDKGRREGKHEGSVKAYAVGYDRGRHDRKSKESDEDEAGSGSKLTGRLLAIWLLPLLVMLLAIVAAAVNGSPKNGP